MVKELIPPPHILLNFINRNIPWVGVFCELIDNALDKDGGNATTIDILLTRNAVHVRDNGRGVDDINRLGTPGDSGSYEHAGNMGQYGVGAKAWMCKANKFTVSTTHAGRHHVHTFDLGPAIRAIEKWQPIKHHLRGYEGHGKPDNGPSGTEVILHDLRKECAAIVMPAIISELQRRYWPGLLTGLSITIKDSRRRPETIYNVTPLEPAAWTDKKDFASSINGRPYKATLGILTDKIGAYGGFYIGYLFRNICVEKKLPNRRFPNRLHGQIELSESWRNTLSNYKDDLIEDKELLLADIETIAKDLLDKADDYVEDWRLNVDVASEIEAVSNDALRRALDGEFRPRSTSVRGTKKASRRRGKKKAKKKSRDEKEAQQLTKPNRSMARGVKLGWSQLGSDVLDKVDISTNSITITLNRDCPKLEALSRQPRYPGVYLAMGHAVARHCRDLRSYQIEEYFSGMLGEAKGSEDINKMCDAIELWWAFLADEQEQEQAA